MRTIYEHSCLDILTGKCTSPGIYYKRTNNPRYEDLFKLDNYKKERIAQIEKEYQEKTKSIPQLLQEYDELVRFTEIPR